MPINLFIDANIFLSFYSLSNADIHQLNNLKGVVKNGDIHLLISDQLEDEVGRNREAKIRESFRALREDNFKCHAPAFVKSLGDFVELQGILKDANKKHSELILSVTRLVESRSLDADRIIDELIEAAGVDPITDKQFNLAYKRFLKGNPPGKKKLTIGDEINWEFMLDKVLNGEDLHLVSTDSDYASPNDPDKASEYIAREWRRVKGAELHFYRDLSDFFKKHVPKIKLANQVKLNSLIAELAASGSFADTHSIVAKFPEDSEFNDNQIVELININENNSQVGWIDTDVDIARFYEPIKKRYLEIKKPETEDDCPF